MKFFAFAVLLAVLLAAAHGASLITGKRYGFGYSSHSHGGYLGGHHGGHGGHGGYGHGSYGHGSYGHGSYGHGSYGHGSYSHGSYGHGGYRGHHHG